MRTLLLAVFAALALHCGGETETATLPDDQPGLTVTPTCETVSLPDGGPVISTTCPDR